MSSSDEPPARPAASEPGAEEIAAARGLLAAIEARVFPGSKDAPLSAEATPIRQAVTRLFGHGG